MYTQQRAIGWVHELFSFSLCFFFANSSLFRARMRSANSFQLLLFLHNAHVSVCVHTRVRARGRRSYSAPSYLRACVQNFSPGVYKREREREWAADDACARVRSICAIHTTNTTHAVKTRNNSIAPIKSRKMSCCLWLLNCYWRGLWVPRVKEQEWGRRTKLCMCVCVCVCGP